MLQTSFDHLTLQLIGVLLNGWIHHECMVPRSIGFDLLPNAFVIVNEPSVGHMFDAHSQLLYRAIVAALAPGKSAHGICVHGVLFERRFSQSDDRYCSRKYAVQRLVRPARFEPI